MELLRRETSDRSGDGRAAGSGPAIHRSLGDLFGELSQEFSNLIHQELQAAKDELRGEATRSASAGNLLLAAGLAAALCIAFVGVGLAWGLAEIIPVGWAFTVVGVLFGGGAVLLHRRARRDADAGEGTGGELL